MAMKARNAANSLVSLSGIKARDATNTLRTIQTVKARDASNALRVIYSAMSALASPSSVSGTQGSFSGSLTITSNSTTATPSGGVAPYSYAWAFTSGDNTIGVTSLATAATAFSKWMALGAETSGVFTCTITDSAGAVATCSVSVDLNHVDLN